MRPDKVPEKRLQPVLKVRKGRVTMGREENLWLRSCSSEAAVWQPHSQVMAESPHQVLGVSIGHCTVHREAALWFPLYREFSTPLSVSLIGLDPLSLV